MDRTEIYLRYCNDENTARGACELQVNTNESPDIEENDNVQSIYSNIIISKRRKYRSDNRQRDFRPVSNIRSRWMEMAQTNKTQIRAMNVFKRLKWFKVVSLS